MFTPRQEVTKIVPLFYHPAFESTLYKEDDIIKLDATNRYEVYAQRIIALWESLGLRRPQMKRRVAAYQDAMGELIAVLKGQHPRISNKKLTVEQIMKSINHWALATLNHDYLPVDKKSYRALDIPNFIYSRFLDHSYMIEYLEPPRTPQKEINPALTKTLMSYFSEAKWGETKNNVDLCNHIHFIKASNRLMTYLDEHRNEFQPLMKLSPKNPNPAARGLIVCAQKSGNWNNYNPEWLYNNISFGKLDFWLRNNGYFKTTPRTTG